MSVYYEHGGITLYLGDCREVTAWLAADVLVTDPPYGLGWTRGRYSGIEPNSGIENDGGYRRASTDVRDAVLVAWGDRRSIVFGDFAIPPLNVKQTLIWQKPADAGFFGCYGGWRRDVEAIYLVGPWRGRGRGDKDPVDAPMKSSVLREGKPGFAYVKAVGHPHAKPVALMERLLSCTTGTVADPFAGSGATLVAARLQGREAVGVELEERYCEVAARRLDQGVLEFPA